MAYTTKVLFHIRPAEEPIGNCCFTVQEDTLVPSIMDKEPAFSLINTQLNSSSKLQVQRPPQAVKHDL